MHYDKSTLLVRVSCKSVILRNVHLLIDSVDTQSSASGHQFCADTHTERWINDWQMEGRTNYLIDWSILFLGCEALRAAIISAPMDIRIYSQPNFLPARFCIYAAKPFMWPLILCECTYRQSDEQMGWLLRRYELIVLARADMWRNGRISAFKSFNINSLILHVRCSTLWTAIIFARTGIHTTG